MSDLHLGLKQRGTLAMTPALRQAIGFLALGNAELSARLADLQSAVLTLTPAEKATPGAWLDLVRQVAPRGGSRPPPMARQAGPGGLETDRIAAADPGLIAHVEAQLPLLVRAPQDHGLAHAFLAALEPSGWLGAPVAEIAAEAGAAPDRAEAVLRQLQQAEPAGLFARSLAECLALQAEDRGLLTPAFAALLDNLPLLAAGDIQALAEECAAPPDAVAAMVGQLRRMDPKPGAAFSQAVAPPRPPDLQLRRDGDGWLLELNSETAPVLRLTPGAETSPDRLREARALILALERRHASVLAIAGDIVAAQDAHLRGQAPLAALTINDLAASTGLHRSTVSRVTAALVLALPRRTVSLRALLCAAAPAARMSEAAPSVQAVLQRMRALVAAEDPSHPLDDAAIARLLLPEGAALARRTVAKYRALAGIPPRSARRMA